MTNDLSRLVKRLTVGAAAVLCIGFAPLAAEFGWVTLQGHTPTYARLLACSVSDAFAFGPESGFAQLTPHWRSMDAWLQLTLATHAVLASVVLLLCLGLLHDGLRTRWPALHRHTGRLTAGLTVFAMALAVVYLLATPMDAIYGGPPFAMGLWGMAVLSIWALGGGVLQARRRNVDAHRAFMLLFAASLFVAPSLRLHWIGFGWLLGDGPHATQATAHVLALVALSVQTPLIAIVAMSMAPRSPRPRIWVPRLALMLPLLTAVGVVWAHPQDFFSSLDLVGPSSLLCTAAIPLAGSGLASLPQRHRQLCVHSGYAMLTMGWGGAAVQSWPSEGLAAPHLALAQGAFCVALTATSVGLWLLALGVARRRSISFWTELGMHGLALCSIPTVHALLHPVGLRMGMGHADAWLSAMVLVPGVCLSVSYYTTAFRCTIAPQPHSPVRLPPPRRHPAGHGS